MVSGQMRTESGLNSRSLDSRSRVPLRTPVKGRAVEKGQVPRDSGPGSSDPTSERGRSVCRSEDLSSNVRVKGTLCRDLNGIG